MRARRHAVPDEQAVRIAKKKKPIPSRRPDLWTGLSRPNARPLGQNRAWPGCSRANPTLHDAHALPCSTVVSA